ncbi:MAG: CoA pyrophosphatase [Ornithinimicrobium sp.]
MSDPAASIPVPPWLTQLVDRVEASPPASFNQFRPPPNGGGRASAVLILMAPAQVLTSATDSSATRNSPGSEIAETVMLTRRAATMRSHAGQVSFPGGGQEPGDSDPVATALREAAEEIGLDAAGVSVLATLPTLHITISGYDVTPVLAWWHQPSQVYPRQPAEVDQVLRVRVADLINPDNRFRVRHSSGYIGPAFAVSGSTIWGFTAGVLDRLLDVVGLTRAWDPNRIYPID